jgi:hypothetical protein
MGTALTLPSFRADILVVGKINSNVYILISATVEELKEKFPASLGGQFSIWAKLAPIAQRPPATFLLLLSFYC